MFSSFYCGIGALLRTLGAQSCGNQALRSNSSIVNSSYYATIRWFTNSTGSDNCPKRPVSAYIRYVQEQQPFYRKQYPGLQLFQLTKHIAVSWKQLSESEKQIYVEAAEKDLQIYKKELSVYEAQLSVAQLDAIKEERRQRKLKRKKMRQKRALTVLGKPKRPRSAFNIFMTEHFEEASGNLTTTKLKNLGDDWNKLPDAQKQPYIQLSQDDQIRYENEMKSWEEQMLDIGREDVLRYKTKKMLKKALASKTKEKKTTRSRFKSKKTSTSEGSRMSSTRKSSRPEQTHAAEE